MGKVRCKCQLSWAWCADAYPFKACTDIVRRGVRYLLLMMRPRLYWRGRSETIVTQRESTAIWKRCITAFHCNCKKRRHNSTYNMFSRRVELRFNTYTISLLLVEVADQKNNVYWGIGEERGMPGAGGWVLHLTKQILRSTTHVHVRV